MAWRLRIGIWLFSQPLQEHFKLVGSRQTTQNQREWFFMQAVDLWNSLPRVNMGAKSLHGLKRRLNKCWMTDLLHIFRYKPDQEVPDMKMVGGCKSIREKVVSNIPSLCFCCPLGDCPSLLQKPEQNPWSNPVQLFLENTEEIHT